MIRRDKGDAYYNVEHISYSAVTEEDICKALPESHFFMDFFGLKKNCSQF